MASVFASAGEVVVRTNSEVAHRIAPFNGKITGAAAKDAFASNPDKGAESEPATLALAALRSDPASVDAVSVLALQAVLRNEREHAEELFRYALILSRRDLQPYMWAIEDGVSRGDINLILRSYDLALRTSREARAKLLPPLSSSLSEPRARRGIMRLLEAEPDWKDEFLLAASSRGDPSGTAALFNEMRRSGMIIPSRYEAQLVNTMVEAKGVEAAWAHYRTVYPEAQSTVSRDPNFRHDDDARTVFDWHFTGIPGISASIYRDGETGQLDFAAAQGTGGAIVQQMQLLPPGRYRLSGATANIDQPEASLYWLLACRDGSEIGRISVPNSAHDGGRFAGRFVVPASCPVQVLSLVARSSAGLSGLDGQVLQAQLEPAR